VSLTDASHRVHMTGLKMAEFDRLLILLNLHRLILGEDRGYPYTMLDPLGVI
jgi:hypothetical protein